MCLFAVSQPRSRSRTRDECPIPVVILPPPRPVYILHNEPPSPHTQRPDGHYRWCPTPCQGSHGPRAPMPRNIRFEDRSRFRGDTRHRRIEESREAEWKGMQQRNIRRPEPAYLGGRRMVKFRDTFDMDPRFRRGDDRTVSEESYSAPRHQHHREASPHDGYYPNDSPNGYPAHPHPGHHDRLPPDYSTECSTNGYRGPRIDPLVKLIPQSILWNLQTMHTLTIARNGFKLGMTISKRAGQPEWEMDGDTSPRLWNGVKPLHVRPDSL